MGRKHAYLQMKLIPSDIRIETFAATSARFAFSSPSKFPILMRCMNIATAFQERRRTGPRSQCLARKVLDTLSRQKQGAQIASRVRPARAYRRTMRICIP